MNPEALATEVGVVRKGLGRVLRNLAIGLVALPFLVTVLHHLTHLVSPEAWRTLAVLLFASSAVGAVYLALVALGVSTERVRRRGRLEATAEGLCLTDGDSRRVFSRSEVASGIVVPQREGARVHLTLANGDELVALAPDEASAERILVEAGVDVAHRRARFPLGGMAARVLAPLLGGAALTTSFFAGLLQLFLAFPGYRDLFALAWIAVSCAGSVVVARVTLSREVVVGTDGVSVCDGAGARRFLPFSEVASVNVADGRAQATRKDGFVVYLTNPSDLDAAGTEALVRRVRQAMRVGSTAPGASAGFQLLDRNGRSLDDWKAALQGLLRRGGAYRDAGPSREALQRLVGDAEAPAERRIAAAVALASEEPTADNDPRTGIRVAADACAHEPVRDALELAARGELDEATLERAVR
ncbi:MAG: hypothetical protein HY909_15355 [Deltaproteobacteria bacterium]|nr:hypothetical protein [Deltaproteobacteria bacterium]